MSTAGKLRNIAFKGALIVMSVALAAFGVLGWADKANALRAYAAQDWALLDPLWPVYAVAAVACLAAQVIAACAVVNFARLAGAHLIWRAGALAFYGVAVFFAAYSADMGAQVVLQSAHRSAYEARETERERLASEIVALSGAIEEERQRLPQDTANVVAERQRAATAAFEIATAAARTRLPGAQRELAAAPPLPREAPQDQSTALIVFLIFLGWAVLEPWGYALAERGREPPQRVALSVAPAPEPAKSATRSATILFFRRAAALLTLGWFSHFATATPVRAEEVTPPTPAPEPVSISQWQDAKSIAFAMRERFDVSEIASKVNRHPSTVYKWFRARDKALSKTAAA
jgi:hypothetical protein